MMRERGYEVRILERGAWRARAFFDDRNMALMAARRFAVDGREGAIAVVEEILDGSGGVAGSRTIYRDEGGGGPVPPAAHAGGPAAAAVRRDPPGPEETGDEFVEPARERRTFRFRDSGLIDWLMVFAAGAATAVIVDVVVSSSGTLRHLVSAGLEFAAEAARTFAGFFGG